MIPLYFKFPPNLNFRDSWKNLKFSFNCVLERLLGVYISSLILLLDSIEINFIISPKCDLGRIPPCLGMSLFCLYDQELNLLGVSKGIRDS